MMIKTKKDKINTKIKRKSTGAPNENIVKKHLNTALLNYFSI